MFDLPLEQRGGADRDVVEEAEALGGAGLGVVAGGTHDGEAVGDAPRPQRLRQPQLRAGALHSNAVAAVAALSGC